MRGGWRRPFRRRGKALDHIGALVDALGKALH